jgi:hypothetical protein
MRWHLTHEMPRANFFQPAEHVRQGCGGRLWLLTVMVITMLTVGCESATKEDQATIDPPQAAATAASPASAASGADRSDAAVPAAASAGTTGRIQDLSFDDVKFDMEKGDPFTKDLLPDAVASLDGTRIRIRGYILPSFQQEGITQFVLVRDNMECCFGPGAALYDCIVVRMLPGRSTQFSVRPVAVSGTFARW